MLVSDLVIFAAPSVQLFLANHFANVAGGTKENGKVGRLLSLYV